MQRTGETQSAAAAYDEWLAGCQRTSAAWLRMSTEVGTGRHFSDRMRGLMDAAGAAPEAGPPGAEAFAGWRDLRDPAVQAWSATSPGCSSGSRTSRSAWMTSPPSDERKRLEARLPAERRHPVPLLLVLSRCCSSSRS